MRLGTRLATGSRSTIHAWGAGAVAKVPLPTTPEGWIESEGAYTVAVHRAGAPVPALLGIEVIDGRAVSIYERIRGPSMWSQILERPDELGALTRSLAELQCHLFTLTAPVELPRQLDRTIGKIRRAGGRVDTALLEALPAIPILTHHCLCHGDLHPGNVIMGDDGPVLIDWFDVARGEPIADVARSLLLLSPEDHDERGPQHLPGATSELVGATHAGYRTAIGDRLSIDPALLDRWMAVLAVARIAEGVAAEPLRRRWSAWRADDVAPVGVTAGPEACGAG